MADTESDLYLDLSDKGLTQWPANVKRADQVIQLKLQQNSIASIEESAVCAFTSLQRLYLYDNRLTSVPATFSCLTSLTELHLSTNNIPSLTTRKGDPDTTEGSPEILCLPPSLNFLYMKQSNLLTVPTQLSQCSQLRALYLMGNNISTLPESFTTLSRLEKLYLNNNNIQRIPVLIAECSGKRKTKRYQAKREKLEGLVALRVLALKDNPLCAIPWQLHLSSASLLLDATPLASIPYEFVSKLMTAKAPGTSQMSVRVPAMRTGNLSEEPFFEGRVTPSRLMDICCVILQHHPLHYSNATRTLPIELIEKLKGRTEDREGGRRCSECSIICYGGQPAGKGIVPAMINKTPVWVDTIYCTPLCLSFAQSRFSAATTSSSNSSTSCEVL